MATGHRLSLANAPPTATAIGSVRSSDVISHWRRVSHPNRYPLIVARRTAAAFRALAALNTILSMDVP